MSLSPSSRPPVTTFVCGHQTSPSLGADDLPRWHSAQLFAGRNEIVIEHGGAVYRLRITSLGKLILTK